MILFVKQFFFLESPLTDKPYRARVWGDWLVQCKSDQLSWMDRPQKDGARASGGVPHDLLQCIDKLTHLTT